MSELPSPNSEDTIERYRKEYQSVLEANIGNLYHSGGIGSALHYAKEKGIELDLVSAFQNGFRQALIDSEDSIDLIVEQAPTYDVNIDLKSEEYQQPLEEAFVSRLLQGSSATVHLEKFYQKNHLEIDWHKMAFSALNIALYSGMVQRAEILKKFCEKRSIPIDYSDPEIKRNMKLGVARCLESQYASGAKREITFANDCGVSIEIDDEIKQAAKKGLINCLAEMNLGAGIVSYAEQMLKFMKANRIDVDLNDPDIVKACRETLEKANQKSDMFQAGTAAMFDPKLSIEHFLNKHKIQL